MKVYTLLLFIVLVTISSRLGATNVLTKEDAEQQLLANTAQLLKDNFYLERYLYYRKQPDHIIRLKEAGYIDLVSTKQKLKGDFELKVLPKGASFLEQTTADFLYFRQINMSVEVLSVKPTAKGDICKVSYKERVKLTPFFKAWKPHCFEDGEHTYTASFALENGRWKLKDAWR